MNQKKTMFPVCFIFSLIKNQKMSVMRPVPSLHLVFLEFGIETISEISNGFPRYGS